MEQKDKEFLERAQKDWDELSKLYVEVNQDIDSRLFNVIKQRREFFQNIVIIAGVIIGLMLSFGESIIITRSYFFVAAILYLFLIFLVYSHLGGILDDEGNGISKMRAQYNNFLDAQLDIYKDIFDRFLRGDDIATIRGDFAQKLQSLSLSNASKEINRIEEKGKEKTKKELNASKNDQIFMSESLLFILFSMCFFILISCLPKSLNGSVITFGEVRINWFPWLFIFISIFVIYEITFKNVTEGLFRLVSKIVNVLNRNAF